MNESESNKRHSGSAANRKHGSGGFSGGGNRGKRYDKSGSSDRKHRGNNRDFNKKNSHRGNNRKAKYASGRSGPKKSGYREERSKKHLNEPSLPPDISERDLDPTVRQDLRSLSKQNAEVVAKHMVASALAMEEDPELALKHARAAKDRAGRVSIARETCGIAAYHAGQWKEALSELRAARRISGGPGLLAVMADCERGRSSDLNAD